MTFVQMECGGLKHDSCKRRLETVSEKRIGQSDHFRPYGQAVTLAGALISGLAVILATSMTNHATANEGDSPGNDQDGKIPEPQPGQSLDNMTTGSLPTGNERDVSGPSLPDLLGGIDAGEAEEAQLLLAGLFESLPSGEPADDSALQEKNDAGFPADPSSDGTFYPAGLVYSTGVSDPSQKIGQIGPMLVTGPKHPDSGFIATAQSAMGILGKSEATHADVENEPPLHILGTRNSDYLKGGDGDDTILGLDGKDFLAGGRGADFLDGGDGVEDVVEYVDSRTGIHVSLAEGGGYAGDAAGDTIINIEFVHGSLHDDLIVGNGETNRLEGRLGQDKLYGMDGNDRLLGGYGADLLDGGDGVDIADYSWSDHGVIVDLSTGIGLGGEAEGDLLISIEYLSGSPENDKLIGDETVNRLWGQDGDDALIGNGGNDRLDGGRGADVLDGGSGTDIADYSNAAEAVILDLDLGGTSGEADGDTFFSIENVYGSRHDDDITGDAANNRLIGNAGNDRLFGQDGADYLFGGEGDDILTGGDGHDVFVFEESFGDDLITDFETGPGRTDRLWLKDQGVDDWAELNAAITSSGSDVVIKLDNGTITLEDTLVTDLHADDFIFG